MSHLFTAGCYVEVAPNTKPGCNSEGGTAFIKAVNNDDDTGKIRSFDVQYVLQKKLSREVQPSRVKLKSIQTTSRREGLPSLLSTSYSTAKRVAEACSTDQPIKPKRSRKGGKTTEDLLLEPPRDVYDYLCKRNKISQVGWLRIADRGLTSTTPLSSIPSQVSADEKNNVMAIRRTLNGVIAKNTTAVSTAFGVTNRSIQLWEKKVNQQRKTRSDKGTSVINNTIKQKSWLTAYQVFKKSKRRELRSEGL